MFNRDPMQVVDFLYECFVAHDDVGGIEGITTDHLKTMLADIATVDTESPVGVVEHYAKCLILKHRFSLKGEYDIEHTLSAAARSSWLAQNISVSRASSSSRRKAAVVRAAQKLEMPLNESTRWLLAYFHAFSVWRHTSSLAHQNSGKAYARLGEYNLLSTCIVDFENAMMDLGHSAWIVHSRHPWIRSRYYEYGAKPCADMSSASAKMMYLSQRLLADLCHDALKRIEIIDRQVWESEDPANSQAARTCEALCIDASHRRLVLRLVWYSSQCWHCPPHGLRVFWVDTLHRMMSRFLVRTDSWELITILKAQKILPETSDFDDLRQWLVTGKGGIQTSMNGTGERSLQDRMWILQGFALYVVPRTLSANGHRERAVEPGSEMVARSLLSSLQVPAEKGNLRHSLMGVHRILALDGRNRLWDGSTLKNIALH